MRGIGTFRVTCVVGLLAAGLLAGGDPAVAAGGGTGGSSGSSGTGGSSGAVDWPQYRADGAHTGDVAAQPGLDPTSVATRGLREAATVPLDGPAAAPTTAAGTVFTVGTSVTAADIATGDIAWQNQGDGPGSWGPGSAAASRGLLLIPTRNGSGFLSGADPDEGGAVEWVDGDGGFALTSPTVNASGGTVWAVTSMNQMWAIAVPSGTFGTRVDVPAGTLSVAAPAVGGARVFLPSLRQVCASTYGSCVDRSVLAAYATSDGTPLWSVATSTGITSSTPPPTAAVSGATVYAVGADGSLGAYAAATGVKRWSTPVGASLGSAPAVVGSAVLVGTATGRLVAVSSVDGHVLWRAAVGATAVSAPAVSGQVAWVTADDALVAVDVATGAVLRPVALGGSAGDPVVASDRVLVVVTQVDSTVVQIYGPA